MIEISQNKVKTGWEGKELFWSRTGAFGRAVFALFVDSEAIRTGDGRLSLCRVISAEATCFRCLTGTEFGLFLNEELRRQSFP